MIYSLVSREQVVLTDFTPHSGNFSQVALDVLGKTNFSKMFGQYATANYSFFTYIKQRYVFLVMVETGYETRIAVNFLKQIQQTFFGRYDQSKRSGAVAHSLKDFKPILQEWMTKYSNKAGVDKLFKARQELNEAQEIALNNMDKVLQRGQKIEILVKKAETLADQSLDMRDTSRKVKNKMWWKNKKVMVGIVLIIVVIITVIVIIVATR